MEPKGWRRTGRELVLPSLLLLLLLVLGALQYRWTGEVSRAEGQRLEAGLHASLARFSDDFDEELVHAFRPFSVSSRRELVEAAADWREQSRYPEIVEALFLVNRDRTGELELSKLDSGGTFSRVEWPQGLDSILQRLARFSDLPRARRFLPVLPFATRSMLALVVPAPSSGAERPQAIVATIVKLRKDRFGERLLPDLVARSFGTREGLDYDVVVVDENKQVLFSSSEQDAAAVIRAPDASSTLFSLGRGLFGRRRGLEVRLHRGPARLPPPPPAELAPDGPPPPFREVERGLLLGRWTVYVRHRAGSLEQAVRKVRRRNLAVGFGVLSILGASVVLLTISARRATELSERKMEFVAGVSHELRTPLAVIRSAAQNLGDGSVSGPEQVKRYGVLIEAQGRRLEDLVEQVLELAGVESRKHLRRREKIPVGEIVSAAVSDCEVAARHKRVAVKLSSLPEGVVVLGDAEALRRAVSNLVANAIKHGGDDNRVSVAVTRRQPDGEVAIEVTDRGPGIPRSELSHLFEAFYRGSRARERQVPGSGLGLRLVQQVAREHGGRIEVSSTPGSGSRFSLVLPEAPSGS